MERSCSGWLESVRGAQRVCLGKHFEPHNDRVLTLTKEIDIDKWKEDIPDDDAWMHFMQKYEWSRPLKFEAHKLYKKILEPIKPRLGENLWDVSEYLRKPVLAR